MLGYSMGGVAGYTEQDQTGYQGYFVKQTAYVAGLGPKFARCDGASDEPFGIIVRGGEGASATNPKSVVVIRRGPAPIVAHDTSLAVGANVGTHSDGTGIAKTADKDIIMGQITKPAAAGGDVGEIDLVGPGYISKT